MKLFQILELYKNSDFNLINNFEKSISENIKEIGVLKMIEIPFKGNYNLDMVFSLDKKESIELFLFKAIEVLQYKAEEEIPFYKNQDFLFHDMIEELSFSETKLSLSENNVLENNCISIIKLKEKDELTFLIETQDNYIFISEIYWKS